jgi:hypothetical protein
VILSADRHGWLELASPLDWVIPVGIIAVGILFWAAGRRR